MAIQNLVGFPSSGILKWVSSGTHTSPYWVVPGPVNCAFSNVSNLHNRLWQILMITIVTSWYLYDHDHSNLIFLWSQWSHLTVSLDTTDEVGEVTMDLLAKDEINIDIENTWDQMLPVVRSIHSLDLSDSRGSCSSRAHYSKWYNGNRNLNQPPSKMYIL